MSVAPKLVVTTERRISPTRVGSAPTAFLRRVTRNVLLHTSSIQPYTGRELMDGGVRVGLVRAQRRGGGWLAG